MAKKFVKVCKEYHTFFEGFQVPVGAIYGRTHMNTEEIFWVCDCPKEIKEGTIHIYMMKRTWNVNQDCRIQRTTWHRILIGKSHVVYTLIYSMCKEIGGIPKVKSYLPEERKPKMPLGEKFVIGLKKHPRPVSKTYKQAQVDGKGFDISWEENVQPLEGYLGCPVEYKGNKPKIDGKSTNNCFGRFDGVGSPRRDGLKVPQSKCKPGKPIIV